MNRIFTLITFCMITTAQLAGQDDYLLTQLNNTRFSEGVLIAQDTTIYTYDDLERLLTIESATSLTEYSYQNNQRTIDDYFLPGPIFSRRRVIENNDEGFTLVNNVYTGTIENLVLASIDSFERNEANQLTREVNYTVTGSGLEKNNEFFASYTSDGSLEYQETLFFIGGELFSSSVITIVFDSDGNRETSIFTINEPNIDQTYSDTTSYFYNQGALASTVRKDYTANGFSNCELVEFFQDGDLESLVTSKSSNIDCSDYVPTRLVENLFNDEILFGQESRKVFDNNEVGDLILASDFEYTQTGSLGDDEVILKSVLALFDQSVESISVERERFYSKKGIVSNDDFELSDDIRLYPNLTEKNSTVHFSLENVAFDNYKIVDVTGQVVSYEPIVDKKNLFFASPESSGLFFFQLLDGKKPVTKSVKLIVK